MSQAYFAALCITSYCKVTWPNDWKNMSGVLGPDWCSRFHGYNFYGSHKYIPDLDEINEALASLPGAGVYGFAQYSDGSRLLLTCYDGIVTIDGECGLKTWKE